MDRISEKLRGCVRVRLMGAFPEGVLNTAAINAVPLWGIKNEDEYTVLCSVYETDLEELRGIARQRMCELEILDISGGSKTGKRIKARAALIVFAAAVLIALAVSGLFIWQIDIYGNERLTDGEILRALAGCGVEYGTFWPGVSSDGVRARMIELLPDIGWMTVNVSGSRATVIISERIDKPEIYDPQKPVDITSKRAGIIERVSVFNGKAEVKRGQAVDAGELLISGTMDSISNGSRYVCAKGEVIARTLYTMTAVEPDETEQKQSENSSRRRYALVFGKRRINLYFSGGKTIDGCDKIYTVYTLGAEGLFSLPVKLVAEELRQYSSKPGSVCDEDRLKARLRKELEDETEGELISCAFSEGRAEGLNVVSLRASCRENIASEREIVQ